MSSIRVLPSVGAILQHVLDAELFLWPQSVPDREHASPVTMPHWASLMQMVHLTLAVYYVQGYNQRTAYSRSLLFLCTSRN